MEQKTVTQTITQTPVVGIPKAKSIVQEKSLPFQFPIKIRQTHLQVMLKILTFLFPQEKKTWVQFWN